jgi:hypothetical protein
MATHPATRGDPGPDCPSPARRSSGWAEPHHGQHPQRNAATIGYVVRARTGLVQFPDLRPIWSAPTPARPTARSASW